MANGSAGSIYVDLLLRDANFRQGLNRARSQTESATQAITSSVKSMAATFAAAFSVSEIIKYTDTWKQLQGRLSLVVSETQSIASVQNDLAAIAERTRQPLEGVYNLYTRISQAIPEANRAQYDLLGVTESINAALAITGEGSAQAASAILQFSQALQSDFKGSAQEINSLLDSAPRLAQAIQAAFGDGSKSLKQLAADSVLNTDTILRALAGVGEEGMKLRAEFAKLPPTVGQAFTLLNNEILIFIGNNNAANAAASLFADVIQFVAKNLNGLADAALFVGVVLGVKYAAAMAIASTASITAAVSTAGLNGAFALLIGTSPAVVSALSATTVATLSLNAALAPIGGLLGAVTIALAGTIFYVGGFKNAIDGLEASLSVVTGKVLKLANYATLLGGASLEEIRAFNREIDKAIDADLLRIAEQNQARNNQQTNTFTPPSIVMPPTINTKDAEERQKELNAIYKQYESVIRGVSKEVINLENAEAELEKLRKAGRISQEEMTTALERYEAELKKSGKEMDQYAKTAAENIQGAFADFLFDPFEKGLDGMLKSFGDMIMKMLAEAQAARLARALFGDLVEGGQGAGIAGQLLSGFFGSFAGGFAKGGTIGAGQWGVVGENGPELAFGGNTGQTIIPQGKIGGGLSVNIINNNGSSVRTAAGTNGADLDVIIDQAVAKNIGQSGTNTNAALSAYMSRGITRR